MKKKGITNGLFLVLAIMGMILSCQPYQPQSQETEDDSTTTITKAICILKPTAGNDVQGVVTFTQTDSGMHVVAEVTGLSTGKHGFHIHEYGDLSAPDGTSAGGHFNPEGNPHAGPNDPIRHVGDLGNITATMGDTARLEMTDDMLSFYGENSILGRSVVIHGGEDDLISQPSGNAGPRVAFGVIGIAAEN